MDYYERRRHRMANPTPRDQMNRFKYGARWKSMVRVTPPKNKIKHPALVKYEQELKAKKAQALVELSEATCLGCCKCNCRCLCTCGKLDSKQESDEPLAKPLKAEEEDKGQKKE